ncbi:MAG: tRNA (guanosine(37)-N1)-methyltransferase TrmD [Candidatus Moranbacteria bacterium]|jgi:tRNA (guanine37-N1)-methyltransferase|nr:tRNA (guanosine(37)-N1)-methyltransferase TrmD [Candidatus Moranbacteria bacterium]MDD5651787.1 tRNA (guanosine(37)-N1)-methyltransferase TrmD [Candidatus Moranbacteria bacterium]MDX9855802.1 tRNA (guanosine(37)-N1)-methyltransferase TrmD [Candidatus Moranbacteria bacterium]
MRFDIITIFPNIFDSYFSESILARAQKEKLVVINVHNLRDYARDKHKTVDDTPYGGGAGMVMKVEPIFNCVETIKNVLDVENVASVEDETIQRAKRFNKQGDGTFRTILFSAKGKKYTQEDAKRFLNYDNIIMICGRYEGVDERVAEHIADEEISIGDYVLTGGEIPAMAVVDSVTRLLPGVLGNPESLDQESFNDVQVVIDVQGVENVQDVKNESIQQAKQYDKRSNMTSEAMKNLEYPQYTKPEEFNGWKVPEVLLSGNHAEIEKWREKTMTRHK